MCTLETTWLPNPLSTTNEFLLLGITDNHRYWCWYTWSSFSWRTSTATWKRKVKINHLYNLFHKKLLNIMKCHHASVIKSDSGTRGSWFFCWDIFRVKECKHDFLVNLSITSGAKKNSIIFKALKWYIEVNNW